jgi:ketosteroid isomerase-like protein
MNKRASMAIAVLLFANAAHAGPKEDILAADRAFSQLSVDKGSNAAFLAYVADDGRIFGTGNEMPIIGKAEAAKRFTDPKEGNGDPRVNVLSWEPDAAGVSRDGALGWSDGHWIFESGPDAMGRRHHITGHYLTVWVKDGKGAWKVQADMGTTDPQPEKKS